MTPTQSVTIGFAEIRAIEARCPCGGVLVIPLPKLEVDKRIKCPGCPKYLWDGEVDDKVHVIQDLFRSLTAWQALGSKEVALTFSIVDPRTE
jgi:hypothetical protein